MINIEKKSSCCGCGACYAVCPAKAITMKNDDEGFSFPVVDKNKCTNCGLCEKVCDFRKAENISEENSLYNQKYFAAFNNDKNVVKDSSSGGIYSLIAEYIISKGGVVYGVYLDDAFKVSYGKGKDKEEIKGFRGSKYVEAGAYEIYQDIIIDLNNSIPVLFTGTPCQVAGLKRLLKIKGIDDNCLYMLDFVCHGVSSKTIWKEYLNYLKNKYGNIKRYVFRGKKKGWHGWYPIIETDKKDISEDVKNKESFILMYQTLYFTRRSCFKCPYTSYNRNSDITLADFWNVDSFAKEMDNNTGTSELLINTLKGQELLEQIKTNATLLECTKEQAWQPHLEYPNHLPKGRRDFWDCYLDEGMEAVIKKYGSGDFMTKAKNKVTPLLKKTGLYTLAGKIYKKIFVKK